MIIIFFGKVCNFFLHMMYLFAICGVYKWRKTSCAAAHCVLISGTRPLLSTNPTILCIRRSFVRHLVTIA